MAKRKPVKKATFRPSIKQARSAVGLLKSRIKQLVEENERIRRQADSAEALRKLAEYDMRLAKLCMDEVTATNDAHRAEITRLRSQADARLKEIEDLKQQLKDKGAIGLRLIDGTISAIKSLAASLPG